MLVEPDTRIFAKAGAASEAALAAADPGRLTLYEPDLAAVSRAATQNRHGPIEPVARTVVTAAPARRPKRHYTVGRDARLAGLIPHLPVGGRDRLIARAIGVAKVKPVGP